MFSRSSTTPSCSATEPERLDRFQERWRRILGCLQGAAAAPASASLDAVSEVIAQMTALGDHPLPSRATHEVLLRAACIAEQTRNSQSGARPRPVRTTYHDRVVNLHQALTAALEHASIGNVGAVADAIQATQSVGRQQSGVDESEWTELHCGALARQLVRLLGPTTPQWLRLYTQS